MRNAIFTAVVLFAATAHADPVVLKDKNLVHQSDKVMIFDTQEGSVSKVVTVNNLLFKNEQSLSFGGSPSQYLSCDWATGGNRKKFTLSLRYKRSLTGVFMRLIHVGVTPGVNTFFVDFTDNNTIQVIERVDSAFALRKETSATFTDTGTWHHLVVAVDTELPSSSERVRVYHDGLEITSWGTNVVWPQDHEFISVNNDPDLCSIGASNVPGSFYRGLLDEVVFVDGEQLIPSDLPIKYEGGFGETGWWLRFENADSVEALGQDSSGFYHDWNLNNMDLDAVSQDVPE